MLMTSQRQLSRVALFCAGIVACTGPEAARIDPSRTVVRAGTPAAASSPVAPSAGAPTLPSSTLPSSTLPSSTLPSSTLPSLVSQAPSKSAPQPPILQLSRPVPGSRGNASKSNPGCRVLAVGDSLTDPKSAGGGYLGAARRQCHCSIDNLGKGGAMVNQMRARLLEYWREPGAQYSHVVVFGGVNDLYSDLTAKRSVEKIVADLTTMYQAAHQRGAKVIAFTVTPWGGFRRYFTELRWQHTLELNRWIRATPIQGITDGVVDGERLLSCGIPERLCDDVALPHRDGLHFGAAGHRRLGAALVAAIGPNYCDSSPDDGPDGP